MREPPVVFLALTALVTGGALLLGPSDMVAWIRISGIPVSLAGAALHHRGWTTFLRRGTTIETLDRPDRLVTDGVYARSRNPMYLGGLFLLAGWILVLGHPVLHLASIAWVPLAEYLWIRPEERLLTSEFRDEWTHYAARVRRWV